ncbi:DUF177 domain-containing protein [Pigmentibacter sp. JX0631]|uniref:YceD family protein n=1 Tax=Pigmentibacter sp. JX0631 TaxID=2976982 RepID=UPI0024688632|nr:DUF177 domain-containing protein [Pigmentibacter sp. JX0631]WGL59891.1 DUF177 domain-containing protein [Pigmentibacter sp. JX0631]
MKKNISLSIPKIGNEVTVIFGKNDKPLGNVLYLEDGLVSESTIGFLTEFSLTPNFQEYKSITGFLKIVKEHMLFRISGEIEFEPLLECVRSLTEFRSKLSAQINCFYTPQSAQEKSISNTFKGSNSKNEQDEWEIGLEDLETYYYNGNILIFDEMIIDSLYCAIPELPLCRENCLGLCSECGEELNLTDINGKLRTVNHKKNCSNFNKLN